MSPVRRRSFRFIAEVRHGMASLGIAIALTAASGSPVTAEQPVTADATAPTDHFERVEKYFLDELKTQHIPGMSVAIVWKDHSTWTRGFGLADVENDVPATSGTVYRIGSMTRMITAVAVLRLVQSGRLGLRASVRDYVPELPDKGVPITVEHLLSQQSGLRTCKSGDELFNKKHYRRLLDGLEVYKDDALMFPPGDRFLSTPYGFHLLGLVVERVTGEEFGVHLQTDLFAPLGMSATRLDDHSAVIEHRAAGYILRKDHSLRNSPFVDLSIRYPSDGLLSTVGDMARFAKAFLSAELLRPEMVEVMTTPYRTKKEHETHYGLGCFVRTERGRRVVGHAGWQPRVSTILLIVPARQLAVILLANLEQADVRRMSLDLVDILLGAATPSAKAPPR